MKKNYVNWSDVERQTQEIIRQMYLDKFHPDWVVGITRGGLTPATLISQYLQVPMNTLRINLRDHAHCESGSWMAQAAAEGHRMLIVDDINDSGATMNWLIQDWQNSAVPTTLAWQDIWNHTVKIAVLYDNQSSDCEVDMDYAAEHINKLEQPQWIVFPWEAWWRKWQVNQDS